MEFQTQRVKEFRLFACNSVIEFLVFLDFFFSSGASDNGCDLATD